MRTARHGMRARALELHGLALTGACAIALVLPACTKQAAPTASTRTSELNWARDALARNPTLEIVATDASAGVFTIRSKDTGDIRTVELDEIAAVPVASLAEAKPATTPAAEAPAPEPTQPPPAVQLPLAESTDSMTSSAQPAAAAPSYTIERTDGKVKVSGPGVSIVSTDGETLAAAAPNSQRTVEPTICEGRRMLHFDNRDIYVEGDAIIARGGCELYITNSRVIASGTGVVVGDAIVHIANSTVEGSTASFDARDGAQIYLRTSTLQGLPRRAAGAVVQDQGGNRWR